MEKENIYAVILAGGSGERFWPLSTQHRPKQFLSLFGGKPLIRHAVDRLDGLVAKERIFVITASSLCQMTREALPFLPPGNIIGEPMRRDTAAASALACGIVLKANPGGIALILTADQLMGDEELFRQTLFDAARVAENEEAIVTIGIAPRHPSTGFGYIEAGEDGGYGFATSFAKARRFVEKPSAAKAEEYLRAGNYYWNSGMFIWSARTMASAIGKFAPELAPLLSLPGGEDLEEFLAGIYPGLPKISVDYAIMEKFSPIVMAAGRFEWDDVGSWPSISAHFGKDEAGNVLLGQARVLDTGNSIVLSGDGGLVAVIGLDDVIAVRTEKATLVCHKSKAQDIKRLLAELDPSLR